MPGKVISKKELNAEVENYTGIQNSIWDHIRSMPPKAKNYYAGQEISFVFEEDAVSQLLAIPTTNPNAKKALRVYYGGNDMGVATVILVAAEIDPVTKVVTNIFAASTATEPDPGGIQWPTGQIMNTSMKGLFDITKDNGVM